MSRIVAVIELEGKQSRELLDRCCGCRVPRCRTEPFVARTDSTLDSATRWSWT